MSRKTYGIIDFESGLRWMKSCYSTKQCHEPECGVILAYGARILYSPKERRSYCETHGQAIHDRIVQERITKGREAEPQIKRLRDQYDNARNIQSPFIRSLLAG
jgi:hypothetical protein